MIDEHRQSLYLTVPGQQRSIIVCPADPCPRCEKESALTFQEVGEKDECLECRVQRLVKEQWLAASSETSEWLAGIERVVMERLGALP